MAWTQTDIDRLKKAMASGALTTRDASGNLITFRSLAEMKDMLALMEAEVAPTTAPPRRTAAQFSKGF